MGWFKLNKWMVGSQEAQPCWIKTIQFSCSSQEDVVSSARVTKQAIYQPYKALLEFLVFPLEIWVVVDHLHCWYCGRIRTSTINYKTNFFLFQCKGNNVRCKCIFPRKRRISLALRVCCMTKVLIFLPWSSYTLGSVTGLSYFLMQISFMDRTLLNQSLFRQIHERKFYITLLKFCSIKHKACHWITKSWNRSLLPIRVPAHRALWPGPCDGAGSTAWLKARANEWQTWALFVKYGKHCNSCYFFSTAKDSTVEDTASLWLISEAPVGSWGKTNSGWVQSGGTVWDWHPWEWHRIIES